MSFRKQGRLSWFGFVKLLVVPWVSLKPHIQICKELLSSLKMPTYFTPCVSYSFRHLIKLESKNYLVSRKTFPTSMSFLEIENYTLPNANEFKTFIFQKGLHKTGKNFHISILILEIFRYGSLSRSVVSLHQNPHRVVKNASLWVSTQILNSNPCLIYIVWFFRRNCRHIVATQKVLTIII